MDLRAALTFPFKLRQRGSMLLTAVLLGAVPYVGYLLVQVWFLPLVSAVVRRDPANDAIDTIERRTLPPTIVAGLKMTVIQAVICAATVLLGLGAWVGILFADGMTDGALGSMLAVLSIGLVIAGFLFAAVVSHACIGRFAMTGTIGDALDLDLILAMIRRQPGAWLLCTLIPGTLALATGLPLTSFLPDSMITQLGQWLATGVLTAYLVLVELHLIGQAYRRSLATVQDHQVAAVARPIEGRLIVRS